MFKPRNTTTKLKRLTYACTIAGSLLASVGAFAAEAYDDELARIDAQINLIRKQGELANALAQSVGPMALSMPSVVSIMGIDGVMAARLIMPNGVSGTYREGDIVRDGMTVAVISPKLVIVKVGKGKKTSPVVLEFVAASSQQMAGPNGPPGPGVPGMPGSGGMPPIPPGLLPSPPVIQMTPMPASVARGGGTTFVPPTLPSPAAAVNPPPRN